VSSRQPRLLASWLWTDGHTDRWMDGQTDERTDKRTDGQADRRTNGRLIEAGQIDPMDLKILFMFTVSGTFYNDSQRIEVINECVILFSPQSVCMQERTKNKQKRKIRKIITVLKA